MNCVKKNSYSYKNIVDHEVKVETSRTPYCCAHRPTESCSCLQAIQVQAVGSAGINLNVHEKIPYNIITSHSGMHIGFHAASREIILRTPGTYLAMWWVVIDGTGSNPHANFSLCVNGVPNSMEVFPSGLATQLSGSSLVHVNACPTSISVINNGTDLVTLADTAAQSNLIVMSSF